MPLPEDLPLLDTDPAKVRAQAYDLVINGEEAGGGTIRCHDPAIQSKIFGLLGLTPEQAEEKFGFLLGALRTAPRRTAASPSGVDRLVMLYAGLTNIRDCIAFPKTAKGTDLMTGAPGTVDAAAAPRAAHPLDRVVGRRGASRWTKPAKARQELLNVLREARSLLVRPGNCFDWSSWEDADAALREVDGLIAALESGRLPSRLVVSVLFAPTGPIQEVSISSGWADEFLTLASRCDAAVEDVYNRGSWWRRLLNVRVAGFPHRRGGRLPKTGA